MKIGTAQQRSHATSTTPSGERSGFTLLELMLVLAVLATIATLSWPGLMRSLKQQSVQGNAEQVRQILDRARVRAVEDGRTLQLRFEPNGKRYVLLPLDPVDQSQAAPASVSRTKSVSRTLSEEPFRIYELSKECFFHVDSSFLSGEKQSTERLGEAWAAHLENPAELDQVAWSSAILYRPDGSATDGSVVVMDQDRQYIKLHVRGLTGAVWSEPIAVMAERLGRTGN
ncbi:pilus assembly FimT family protein [Planctomicrobium sp. SH661]|uniref:pilus assembly FimT family protein n=1 Tax=Planctomicrobium sp. SH661 TaxID=3448124 RepID=UPI003F5B28E8